MVSEVGGVALPQRYRELLALALGGLIVVACLAAYMPVAPYFPTDNLDNSWALALNVAVARGMAFGRTIIFTFGPYAATYTEQYYPGTASMMVWSSAILGGAFAAMLLCLARGWHRAVASLLALFLGVLKRDVLFLALPFAYLSLCYRIYLPAGQPGRIRLTLPVTASLLLALLALGLLPLVKGTFGAPAIGAVGFGGMLLVLARRRRLALGGVLLFLVAMPVFWVVAGQKLASLPGYFLSQGPIVSGYSEAMSTQGDGRQPLLFLVACVMLGLVHARALRAGTVLLLLGAALQLFLAFKAGFIRAADDHVLIPAGLLAAMAWMLLLGRMRWRAVAGLAVGLACLVWIELEITQLSFPELLSRIAAQAEATARTIAAQLTMPGAMEARYADSVAAIRAADSLPPLQGRTDIYPFGQSVLLANGLDWAPRPVLQSYSAYTPSLEADDAAHLAGSAAPENILFAVQAIDGRLPALEDGASWPALLSRYEFTGLQGDLAILRRRGAGMAAPEALLQSGTFQMGQPIELPAAAVWARIDVEPTLLGRVVGAAYKLPELAITYDLADGTSRSFRYVAGMGQAGFLAAPLVQTSRDFMALALPNARDYFAGTQARSISFSTASGSGWLWRSDVAVRFYRAEIAAQPGVGQILLDQLQAAPAAPVQPPLTDDCTFDLINHRRPFRQPVDVGSLLEVEGWAAVSVQDAAAPDRTFVTLTSKSGEVDRAAARIVGREDVNRSFGKPEMGRIGYRAAIDLSHRSGEFLLGLELIRGGKSWVCRVQVPVRVSETDAPAK